MERENHFTMRMQVKNRVVSTILDNGSQRNLVSASLVKDLGLDLEECPNPYEISGRNRDESDLVTHMCTFKFVITKEYIDEVTCDVVPMDCTSILFDVPFLIARKATIIPYLGRCEIEKEGQPFVLKSVLVPRATSLLSTLKDKQVVQTQRKFVLTEEGTKAGPKIGVDQAYQ